MARSNILGKIEKRIKKIFRPQYEKQTCEFSLKDWKKEFPTIAPCYDHLNSCVKSLERSFDYCASEFEGKEITPASMKKLAMLTTGINHMGKRLEQAKKAQEDLMKFLTTAMEENDMGFEIEEDQNGN